MIDAISTFGPGIVIVAGVVLTVYVQMRLARARKKPIEYPRWMSWRCPKCGAGQSRQFQIFHTVKHWQGENGLSWLRITCYRCGAHDQLPAEDRRPEPVPPPNANGHDGKHRNRRLGLRW